MFDFLKPDLTPEMEVEICTAVACNFSQVTSKTKNPMLMSICLNNVELLAEQLGRLKEGQTIESTTLKHGEIKITRKDGRLLVENNDFLPFEFDQD